MARQGLEELPGAILIRAFLDLVVQAAVVVAQAAIMALPDMAAVSEATVVLEVREPQG